MMAEAIGVASGVVALVTAGIQATSSLLQFVGEFNRAPRSIRELKVELEALDGVLRALEAHVEDDDADVTAVKVPLQRCTKACEDFELILDKVAGRSESSKASFTGWAKIKYHGDDINGFKDAIAGYKATISVALGINNLRKSAITLQAFNEFKDMISDTTCDLQERLRAIDGTLQSLLRQENDADGDYGSLSPREVQEERDGVQQCLEICENVSRQVEQLQRASVQGTGTRRSTPAPALAAWLAAARDMTGCKNPLEDRLRRLTDDLQKIKSNASSKANMADEQDLRDEITSLQQGLEFCKSAFTEAERHRTNVFEDVKMADDGRQAIVSTVGDLIFARRINIGARSVQMLGQASDQTVQHVVSSRYDSSIIQQPLGTSPPREEFKERYGAGRDLRSSPTKDLSGST